MTSTWTMPGDVAARVRKSWDTGALLAGYARGEDLNALSIVLRGPKASEVGDDLAMARAWVAALDAGRKDGRRYDLEWQAIGGRNIGRNKLPVRAIVSSYSQAWELLGVGSQVARFDEILAVTSARRRIREWAVANPHRALELEAELPALVAAFTWLDEERTSGRYLREISAPGVDTKLVERHRPVLAQMLGVPPAPSAFLAALGLQAKPELVRLRPSLDLGLPPSLTELAVRPEELAALSLRPTSALVVENEISYLSVSVPDGGVVLWGKGFDVDRVGRLPWLVGVPVTYWGDVDTHGFAILDRLRAWLPQARSVLMDQRTLLAHRERWGVEDRPTRAALTRLTATEVHLYEGLVTDAFGTQVRLEQERIDWSWVGRELAEPRLATEVSDQIP